nr:Glutathione S-transferase-like protein [Ipomoea batatas]
MGKGKAKIAIKKIESLQARNVCFTKRRKGLFKKAAELGHLFPEVRIAAVVFSPAGNPYVFGDLSEMEKLLAMEESRKERMKEVTENKNVRFCVQDTTFASSSHCLEMPIVDSDFCAADFDGFDEEGYSASFVDRKEIPPDQYALEIAGFAVKETSKLGPRPEKPIEIYEFESCPFCRKVREIVAILDLDVLFYPCPRNGQNFRPKVAQMGGKQQFPYMVDPNTGVAMYESDEIIKYLVGKYGDGQVPLLLSLGLLTGSSYTPSKLPPKPLEIWAYEPSPFCKIVREVLVELELPHILHRSAVHFSLGLASVERTSPELSLIA